MACKIATALVVALVGCAFLAPSAESHSLRNHSRESKQQIKRIHRYVQRTHQWQRRFGNCCKRHRHTWEHRGSEALAWLKRYWKHKARHAYLRWRHVQRARARAARIPSVWIRLADCETGDGNGNSPPYSARWDYNGSSGFDGGIQFNPGTWNNYMPGYAWQYPASVQVRIGQRLQRSEGWGQWPACASELGLR